MPEPVFVIVRDARGSLVHVRRRDDGECVGCIEVGLYEIVRAAILPEGGTASGATREEGQHRSPSRDERNPWRDLGR
jgi:hypothetical protein